MKRPYLLFVLVLTALTVPIIAGHRCEDVTESKYPRPYKAFVTCCREAKLTERMSEYRTKIEDLVEHRDTHLKSSAAEELIMEIAWQGDFESLEILERDLPPHLKERVWLAVSGDNVADPAKKLLIKWAQENPTVPTLMQYHPNGVELLITMAEDKSAPIDDRPWGLELLGRMPAATKVLDRIKALMSDQTKLGVMSMINAIAGVVPPGYEYLTPCATIACAATKTVHQLEAIEPHEKNVTH